MSLPDVMPSASAIALAAVGARPVGTPYRGERGERTHCATCGTTIGIGDPCQPWGMRKNPFFANTRDLDNFHGLACGACSALKGLAALTNLARSVCTRDGVYKINLDEHKAWLLLTPPEPPFVAVYTSANSGHLIWRTPVTLSRELITLREGQQLYSIRPRMLRALIELAERIQALRQAQGESHARRSPFLVLDRSGLDPNHGRLNPRAQALMTPEQLAFVHSLTSGEIWAASIMLKAEPTRPEPPPRATFSL